MVLPRLQPEPLWFWEALLAWKSVTSWDSLAEQRSAMTPAQPHPAVGSPTPC